MMTRDTGNLQEVSANLCFLSWRKIIKCSNLMSPLGGVIRHVPSKRNGMAWAKNVQQNSRYPSQQRVTGVALPMESSILQLISRGNPC